MARSASNTSQWLRSRNILRVRDRIPLSSTIIGCFGLAICLASLGVQAQTGMTIGVLAFRGDQAAYRRWSPTARYLSEKIPGYDFRIEPLSLEEMSSNVSNGNLDFILTNTGNYVTLEHLFGISRLATLKASYLDHEITQFGAVIFTRADQSDINNLQDVAGRSMMAVSRNAFGGFQMAWRELVQTGIDPFEDLSKLDFAGFPQDDIVYSVIRGEVEVGTVRSGTLERMSADKLIDLGEIKVIGRRDSGTFPFLHSTRLYPEWPFAKARDTPEQLAHRVAIALLEMEPESDAARKAFATGWTIPLDYSPVLELFRELEIGPYEYLQKPSLESIWREYKGWILSSLIMTLLLVVLTTLVARANRKLSLSEHRYRQEAEQRRLAQESLAEHMDVLELRVKERTDELAEINRRAGEHQAHLAHVARLNTMGEMATGIAHELNQPLTAIRNYSNVCLRLLRNRESHQAELTEAVNSIEHDAHRAAVIIKRLREFIKRGELVREDFSIRECIEPAVELLRPRLSQHGIEVDINYSRQDAMVHADRVQIEQVIVNLVLNAIDAVQNLNADAKKIEVQVSQIEDGQTAITVSDSGDGLPASKVERLFEPFFTTKAEGLGMGLSISRSIVEAHEGKIEYLLNEQGRPTFRFTVPTACNKDIDRP
jgi:two-component system sensor histidine kinase TtrS